jgi:hypothetical protein
MLQKAHRLALLILAGIYTAVSLVGLVSFLAFKSTSVTDPVGKPPPHDLTTEINLAHFRQASWLEASSYAWLYIHHPLFVIDGLPRPPSNKEEWVPDKRTDKKPWMVVHLGRKATISRVVVVHEGRYSERFYTVSCMRGEEKIKSVEAIQSAEATVTLPLACRDVDAVRLDFKWDPDSATGHIRIYEIEVWGK